ncbi:MAG: NAD(P)-binding domain-containing protein [Burkholderiaceae bacterium]
MSAITEVTIVGAGPYGLSIAAHLQERNAKFCIIGSTMQSWLRNMPKGMLLKSAGLTSSLVAPRRNYSLRQFCAERGIPYEDMGMPVAVETFAAYGVAFQQQFVPEVRDVHLVDLQLCPAGFSLSTADGESFTSRKVVLATGLDTYRHIPPVLTSLPRELGTHSADHHDVRDFRGRDVLVIGGGAAAIDLAVLLYEAQANVQLIARKPVLNFLTQEMHASTLMQGLRKPLSGVWHDWQGLLCSDAPWLYRYLFDRFRLRVAKKFLGPSGGSFMRDRLEAVPKLLGFQLIHAEARAGRARLLLAGPDGRQRQVLADHVIAATGYEVDVRRLGYLSAGIIEKLQLIGPTPRLSAHFESSVPGLYFVGAISATSFGPSMRFIAGSDFTCQRIVKHLMRPTANKGAAIHQLARVPEPDV